MDNRKISLCITHYNRASMVMRSFIDVMDDERIGEIIIVDDHSDLSEYNKLVELCRDLPIKIIRNETNLGCFRNKKKSIESASYDWCIVLDSDNVVNTSYIDKLYEYGYWGETVAYAPDFAKPNFDYRAFDGCTITRKNVHLFLPKPGFEACLNTMNYFVNRDEYLRVWSDEKEPYAIDSIWQNLQWLKAGNMILVTPGLEYEHRVHSGSLYMELQHKTKTLYKEIINELKFMR